MSVGARRFSLGVYEPMASCPATHSGRWHPGCGSLRPSGGGNWVAAFVEILDLLLNPRDLSAPCDTIDP